MKWLSDVKQGKYIGIQQAGLLYGYAKDYPMYVELTVHELMEKLNSNNQKIRKNAYWMLSKISEQFQHHKYLVPTIPILAYGLKERNESIRNSSLKTLLNISNTLVPKILYLKNDLINLFYKSNKSDKSLILKILVNFLKSKKLKDFSISDDFILEIINDPDLLKDGIDLLMFLDTYKNILPVLIENLHCEKLSSVILEFINKLCKNRPFKIIMALKKTLVNQDPFIRQNSLLIFEHLKHNSKIYLLIPEILRLIQSKIKSINRISLFFLYDIHTQILKELIFYKDQLYKLRKLDDNIIKLVINAILIDIASIDYKIIEKFRDKIFKQIKKYINSDDLRLRVISLIAYSKIMIWTKSEENIMDSIKFVLKPILLTIREYPIKDYEHQLYYRIALLYYYLNDFKNAENYFKKSIEVENSLIYNYRSRIFLILTYFSQYLPKTALNLTNELIEVYKNTKNINKQIINEIKYWERIFDQIFHLKIDRAIEILDEYYANNLIKNNWEICLRNIIKENIIKIKGIIQ
ncbi:MAG: tetratricopeptide repeat protein [Candidatus Helarchaeota archaeon]